jgi:Tol biopolymer transport system component/C-terminal processing protease CtpA/Prc
MKTLLFSLFSLIYSFTILAQDDPLWMRYPSISPDGSTIVFTYKGDLYKVPSSGGDAIQLTYHEAHDYAAVWSRDGKTIAFASDRYGNFDIYTMDPMGGPATRLTFHSNDEKPFSFTHDDQSVLFGAVRQDKAQHRQYPTGAQPELYSVPVAGGRIAQVLTVPAEDAIMSSNGGFIMYHDRKGYENEWRKHHTSSITRDIWKYDVQTGMHTMITSYNGEDRQPVLTADNASIYYLSESSGTFNVHKLSLDAPATNEQLTSFSKHPVRFLSIGSGNICFGFHGEIYTMREGTSPQKVNIKIRTQDKSNSDKFITINGGVREMDVSPDGKEIAFIARGEVFVTSVDESFTKRITNTPEQERFVSFAPDGKSIIYAAERDGKWIIYKSEKVREEEPFFFASTLLKESTMISNNTDNYLPEISPDGKKMAFIEGRRTLKVMNLEDNSTVTLLTPDDLYHMRDGDQDFTWSPDSKWLLVDWGVSLSNNEVLLIAADGSRRMNLNESGYYDGSPKWVNEGKQMLWFTNSDGLKSYATSGRTELDVYTMFFDSEAWDKFNMSKEEYSLFKEIEKANKKDDKKEDDKKEDDKKKKKKEVKDLVFDWDNMKDRTSRLTIHSSRLGDAVLSKDGETLYYLARFEDKMNLWTTNLRTKETKMAVKLSGTSGSLMWDDEMENLYLLSSGKISIVDVEKGSSKGVNIKGEMPYDANAERQYMFDHVWLRTNAIFYHPDFHGIDWDDMRTEYEKQVPHIDNSYEFAELLSEMLGELNVSHAGARFSRDIDNGDATASLGIFMNYDHTGTGILIDEIMKGGPLDKANLDIKVGDIIEKIDGETITADKDVAQYFNRKADQFVLIEVVTPGTQSRRQYTVKPTSLREENSLLYTRWVKNNEKEVAEKSNGTLGYVHIPGMGDGPFRSIYKDMMGKYFNTKGVIVDTRFNGGGDLVADLAMFFTGEPFITYATEARVVGGEPTSRWTKPTLALFNESMYSDGHCFACGYTDLKLGKTIGMPVPGTCSFAGWEGLPDGTRWGVVPVSAKDKQGNWMENNQTDPQIMIKNMPGIIDFGRDQQLERAIEEMLKDVGQN